MITHSTRIGTTTDVSGRVLSAQALSSCGGRRVNALCNFLPWRDLGMAALDTEHQAIGKKALIPSGLRAEEQDTTKGAHAGATDEEEGGT